MGSGYGYIDGATGLTLENVLHWIEANSETWGTITIYKNNKIIRCFDYDIYNRNQFFHNLSGWMYKLPVKEVKFEYCFMNKDIFIYTEN